MKRLLAIALVLLMAVASVSAQRLTVTEVRQAMEPMTVPMQRLDYNNEICALVKVSLPVAGAGFEGNTVGEPLFKINEYWVYLTPGTKMLNIKAPGYHSLMVDFREYGISALESKSIYYVVLDAEGGAPVHQTVTANYGVFTVQPTTAIVKIDGQPQQVVDGSVIALLKLGNHTWQAEAVGYAPASGMAQAIKPWNCCRACITWSCAVRAIGLTRRPSNCKPASLPLSVAPSSPLSTACST